MKLSVFTELSLQFVSMFLRSEPDYELVEPCKEFGVRIRKCFFMVRPKQQPKQRFLLSWVSCFYTDLKVFLFRSHS